MSSEEKKELIRRVDHALETVRPHLKVDGGNVEVVDVNEELTVFVKWLGTCQNCSMSTMTMKAGVEQAIKSQVSEIVAVEAINGIIVN